MPRVVHWIDSKAMFGSTDIHKRNGEQLDSYEHRFGSGMVLYWLGCVNGLSGENTLAVPSFPSVWKRPYSCDASEDMGDILFANTQHRRMERRGDKAAGGQKTEAGGGTSGVNGVVIRGEELLLRVPLQAGNVSGDWGGEGVAGVADVGVPPMGGAAGMGGLVECKEDKDGGWDFENSGLVMF